MIGALRRAMCGFLPSRRHGPHTEFLTVPANAVVNLRVLVYLGRNEHAGKLLDTHVGARRNPQKECVERFVDNKMNRDQLLPVPGGRVSALFLFLRRVCHMPGLNCPYCTDRSCWSASGD